MNVGSLFSGIGLLDYGLHLAGLQHSWGCEADEWRRGLWKQRFRVPCHDDVRAVDARVGRVDVVAGGFPCKGASTAGKREGFGHPETVLWREMRRAIGDLRPRYVVVENVANILALHDGAVWGEVVGDLAALGYDTEWDCLPAAAFGAPHLRDRVFAIAAHTDPDSLRLQPAGEPRRGGEAELGQPRKASADANGSRTDADTATGRSRPSASERDQLAPDSSGERGQGTRPGRAALGGAQANGGEAVADTDGRLEAGPEQDQRTPGGLTAPLGNDPERRGVRVEWGEYEPAIRRWEAIHGPAPEPLVRRVDDRSAARLERLRLSALGDGVLVQAGWLVGCRLLAYEEERLAA